MECVVEFEYEANEDDELTLKKGDIITNVSLYEDGWMKGTLRGKEGVFPDNFVKITKNESKTAEKNDKKGDAFRKSQEELLGKKLPNVDSSGAGIQKARVVHKYVPRQKDELPLEIGAIIEILPPEKDDDDDGWLRGSCAGKVGVFPANFVTLLSPPTSRRPGVGEASDGVSQSSGPTTGGKKVMGVGFGNIFDGEQIQLRPVAMKDVKRDNEESGQAPKLAPRPNKPGAPADSQTRPSISATGRMSGSLDKERVIVKFPYPAENADELNIEKGDIITVIDKNLEDEGWWKGELNGRIGVFPDNFVEPLPPSAVAQLAKEEKAKPARPVPPLPTEKPAPPDKPSANRKGGPPPVIPKKPAKSTNGRANSVEKPGDIFESVPDHQPLSALTSDRPRVANKRPPSKEFLRASGTKEGVLKGSSPALRSTGTVQDELPVEKEEEKPFLRKDPPPRPNNRPSSQAALVDAPALNVKLSGASKTSTLTSSSAAPTASVTSAPPVTLAPAPALAPVVVEAGVSPSELTELRSELNSRLTAEVAEVRAEMERMRVALMARLHSLAAEVDEEKRQRHSAQVELERVRKMLQEKELGSVSFSSSGQRSSNA